MTQDEVIPRLKAVLDDIRQAIATCRKAPGSPEGKRAFCFLLRESRRERKTSEFYFLYDLASNKIEADKLEKQARQLLAEEKLKALKGSNAGRKMTYADAREQAIFGARWLIRHKDKKLSDAALHVLTKETPKRNAKTPPEWMDGYPYLNASDNERRSSLKKLGGGINYYLKTMDKK